jgi:hypothetical protein
MKRFLFLAFCMFFYQSYLHSNFIKQEQKISDPLLAIVIMVKNEALVIEETLQPFFEAGIQHYLIFDTGSTDGTVSLTLELFEKYNIKHGHVVEKPFVDFAISRNQALQAAEEIFPHANFFFMIDAEWYVKNVPGLITFCKAYKNSKEDLFHVRLGRQDYKNYIPRLFKAHKGICFCGAVHEYINKIATIKVPDDSYIYWNPSRLGVEKSRQRWYRDCDLLLKEHDKNPEDARTVFYLAQSYDCLNNFEQARYWYEKRCEMIGFHEETYMAHIRVAQAYRNLDNWPKALFYFIRAYSLNPRRVEPLICLADYYLKQNNFAVSYMFALQAVKVEQSSDYVLFINQVDYDYTRYDILGIVAWYVGEYEEGKKAVLKALEHSPDSTHLLSNLALYEAKIH